MSAMRPVDPTPENRAGTAAEGLDAQLIQWREYLARHAVLAPSDIDELDSHLRDQIDDLRQSGLSSDEAFLVAVKRLGSVDAISREFAREHSDRLWKQLVLSGDSEAATEAGGSRGLIVALVLAGAAAVAVRLPAALGVDLVDGVFYARNFSLLVLPFLAAYFAWCRHMSRQQIATMIALPVVLFAAFINLYPFDPEGQAFALSVIHLPIVLWFVVGVAYVAGDWRSETGRMDFVRFSGEWAIYYTLIALGGAVLVALTAASFAAIGVDVTRVLGEWVIVCGAAGAVIVAGWLVEAKQSVVENMAPVLTRVFTPLTTIMLVALFLATLVAGRPADVERELLIIVDVVLVLVLGLLLYAVSARDRLAPAGLFDRMLLALVVMALAVDVLMLSTMLTRIADGGVTANKVAALGLNLILMVNLAHSARLSWGFLRARTAFAALEAWQMRYLPVFAVWAAVVVVVFPVLFD